MKNQKTLLNVCQEEYGRAIEWIYKNKIEISFHSYLLEFVAWFSLMYEFSVEQSDVSWATGSKIYLVIMGYTRL